MHLRSCTSIVHGCTEVQQCNDSTGSTFLLGKQIWSLHPCPQEERRSQSAIFKWKARFTGVASMAMQNPLHSHFYLLCLGIFTTHRVPSADFAPCRVPSGPLAPLPTSPLLPTAANPRAAEILWAGDGLVLGSWFWGEEEAASTRCSLRAVWLWAGQHWVKAFWDTSHIQNNQILPDLYASNP